ncbi:hypothetical protein NXS09_06770 [Neisseria sp. CSL10203-ORH2]|uniref:Uncharacterized protein n=2 Tax=Neisseria montereyensis TaxID=2973938 RepID=A0ABT2FER2_9NEIS|nr:hypothetical protein [Neisseria montereyensis]
MRKSGWILAVCAAVSPVSAWAASGLSAETLAGTWQCVFQERSGEHLAEMNTRLNLQADGKSQTQMHWHFFVEGDTLDYRIQSQGRWRLEQQTLIREENPFEVKRGHRRASLKNKNIRDLDKRWFGSMQQEVKRKKPAVAQARILSFNGDEMVLVGGEKMQCTRVSDPSANGMAK